MKAFRDILVAVIGLTPQVITETLYVLTRVRQPPASLTDIHVLTTRPGEAQLLTHLLNRKSGHFYAFCEEYDLDPTRISFEVHILRDAARVPLEDIRTAADSAAVADQIAVLKTPCCMCWWTTRSRTIPSFSTHPEPRDSCVPMTGVCLTPVQPG